MKFLTLLFLQFVFIVQLYGQAFEGVLTYNITYEVVAEDRTDLEVYKSMIPKEMKMFIKGPSSMLQFAGGNTEGILGDILYRTSDKAIYSIFHSTKTYTKTPLSALKATEKSLKAEKTDSTQIILGYKTIKYLIKDEKEGTETVIWVAKEINNNSTKIMAYFLESMTEISVAGIEGLPLKIQFKGDEFHLTLLAEKKESKSISPSTLTVPKSYKISKADPQLH